MALRVIKWVIPEELRVYGVPTLRIDEQLWLGLCELLLLVPPRKLGSLASFDDMRVK